MLTTFRACGKLTHWRRLTQMTWNNMSETINQKTLEDDFNKVEIRVGQITRCQVNPNSQQLYHEEVDVGWGTMKIGSKLVQSHTIQQMMKHKVLVVCNMKPRKLAGVQSQGMLLAAKKENAIKLIEISQDIKNGSRVYLQGKVSADKRQQLLNTKKKHLQRSLEALHVGEDGDIRLGSCRLMVGEGQAVRSNLTGGKVS